MNYQKTILDNGMVLVTERMDTVRSVSLGLWVRTGARDETEDKAGISHFLEHMYFKGTRKRSTQDIAMDIDSLGGELNAFTSKECTTYYIKVLDDFLDSGIDLLLDIFLGSTFPDEEIEREKGVVSEEIRMTEDTPDDYVHDIFSSTAWGNKGIGQAVLGNLSTVGSISRGDLVEYVASRYGIENTIISCAGNLDVSRLTSTLNRAFKGFDRRIGSGGAEIISSAFQPSSVNVLEKNLSEAHVCLGVEGIRQSSQKRYAALVLNTLLGGGISSRLFQEIREKRGLAYSVYSFLSSYIDNGVWGIYFGTSPERLENVLELCLNELRQLPSSITHKETERAKTQLKGNIMLGLESTSRRMQNIANQEMYYGEYFSPERVIERIDSVTVDDVSELCLALTRGKSPVMAAIGPVSGKLSENWSDIRI